MNKCRICTYTGNSKDVYHVKEMMFGTGKKFTYFICPTCGCLQLSELPDNIEQYYQNYYTNYSNWKEISRFRKILWATRTIITNFKIYSFVEKLTFNSILHWKVKAGINKKSKILDIGCGNGDLLYEFRKHGFRNLTGIDPNLVSNKIDSRITLYKKSVFDIENKFDLIMFNHSFEHVWEQHSTLEKAKDLLEENGKIIIRIPVLNNAFTTYKENWVQIDAPRHFYLHSMESINNLCSQHGLQIYHKYFDSSEFQFIGSEQYEKGIPLFSEHSYLKNRAQTIFTNLNVKELRKKARQFNKEEKGDQVVLFIKRIG